MDYGLVVMCLMISIGFTGGLVALLRELKNIRKNNGRRTI